VARYADSDPPVGTSIGRSESRFGAGRPLRAKWRTSSSAYLRSCRRRKREAFVLLRYEGLSVQEAADVLGSTPTAVKLRAFRAYEALRAALGRGP